jgi:hypothetical protein
LPGVAGVAPDHDRFGSIRCDRPADIDCEIGGDSLADWPADAACSEHESLSGVWA